MNAHTMFFDPQHNSRQTILTNIYRNFAETAMKCYCHCKSLPPRKLPRAGFMTSMSSLSGVATAAVAVAAIVVWLSLLLMIQKSFPISWILPLQC